MSESPLSFKGLIIQSKRTVLLFLVILLAQNGIGQELYWMQETFSGFAIGGLDVSPEGNTVVTGSNSFVAKYDTDGQLHWKVEYTQTTMYSGNRGLDVCFDKYGNVFVVGTFDGDLTIQDLTLQGGGSGNDDSFVAKFDSNGSIQWLTRISSSKSTFIFHVEPDQKGDCYIAGKVELPLQVGDTTIAKPANSTYNSLIAKIDSNGELIWSQLGYSTSSPGLVTNKKGELYLLGNFQHWMKWGADSISTLGLSDQYLAKIEPDGNFEWLNVIGNQNASYTKDYCLDEDGHCTIYCLIEDDIYINNNLINAKPGLNHTVISFDQFGSFKWISQIYSDTSRYYFSNIIVKPNQSISLFGSHTEIIDSTNYQNYKQYGFERFQFDRDSGTSTDTLNFGNYPNPSFLEVDEDGNLYFYGHFLFQVEFSDTTLYSNESWYSSYLAKVTEGQIELPPNNSINVYPNPFCDEITIVLKDSDQLPNKYEIFNVIGQEIRNGIISDFNHTVNTSSLSSGIYLLRIDKKVYKLIKR